MTTTTPDTEQLDKIQTWDMALERVRRKGARYMLSSASPLETDGHVPTLVYDAEEQTIWSKGGRKHDVTVETVEDPVSDYMRTSIEYSGRHPWTFGPRGTADAHSRAQIQATRARALISYALEKHDSIPVCS